MCYSGTNRHGDLAPRSGFMHVFEKSEFLVKKWDSEKEEISCEGSLTYFSLLFYLEQLGKLVLEIYLFKTQTSKYQGGEIALKTCDVLFLCLISQQKLSFLNLKIFLKDSINFYFCLVSFGIIIV